MERAIYRELLDICYDTELPLPLSKKTLYRKISAKTDEEKAIVDQLLAEFFSEEVDGFHNARVDKEISAYRAKAESARENGKMGGRPKIPQANIAGKTKPVNSLKPKETDSVILANPALTQPKANQEPITNNHKPRTSTKEKAATPSALPDWLPMDSWLGYLEMRTKNKKQPTGRAIVLLIAALDAMRISGQNIAAVLDRSTTNNWTDVYAIKDVRSTSTHVATPIDLAAAQRAATEEGRRRLFGDERIIDAK